MDEARAHHRYLTVQHGVQGSGSTQTLSVTETQVTIDGLEPSTTYEVEVAALNSVGTGVFSSPISITTPGEIHMQHNSIT